MKAIVMAGGEGTRLRPLTCGVPKPMVTLLDKPMLEYAVEHLARHGILDLAFTLMYLPRAVMDYFADYGGAEIEYFIENEPLGTAGSVKNAASFTDETFIVTSGDALTDIDLTDALRFHKQSEAAATIVLKKMGSPLEYGVVITNEEGGVERFLEKPGWEDVFSDTVNTGIYILEPEVLGMIPSGHPYDFSKDLFPRMLEKGIPIAGYVAEGYWCDVGNVDSYIKAHEDILRGTVKAQIPGRNAGGFYVGEGADISNSSLLQAPCFIGEGAYIGEGVKIGAYTSVGRGCRISAHANIKRSVLLSGVSVGKNTKLSSCVVGSGSTLGERCSVYEGAVIGERCILAGENTVSPHVKIWPEKRISSGASAGENIVWGYGERAGFLGINGFAGDIGADITPLRLGRIFGAAAEFTSGKSAAVASDGSDFGDAAAKQAAGVFTQSGVDVYSMRGVLKPVCAYVAGLLGAPLCVSIKSQNRTKLYADLFEPDIYILSKNARKKIEGKYFTQGERLADCTCGREIPVGAAEDLYISSSFRGIDSEAVKSAHLRALVRGGRGIDVLAQRALSKCGVKAKRLETEAEQGITEALIENEAEFALRMSRNGTFCTMYLPDGSVVGESDFETIAYYLIFSNVNTTSITLPSSVSRSTVSMAQVMGLSYAYASREEALRTYSPEDRRMLFDGIYAVCRLAEHIAHTGVTLPEIAAMIEPEHKRVREISCDWDDIGRVIKEIYGEGEAQAAEGLRLDVENGSGYIFPHATHPRIIIRTEGFSEEYAEELCEKYTDMVKKILKK